MRQRYAKDKVRIASKAAEQRRARYVRMRIEALALFGSACKECGYADARALQFDHISGGGGVERAKSSSETMLRRIMSEPKRFQLLCANCHHIKSYYSKVAVAA